MWPEYKGFYKWVKSKSRVVFIGFTVTRVIYKLKRTRVQRYVCTLRLSVFCFFSKTQLFGCPDGFWKSRLENVAATRFATAVPMPLPGTRPIRKKRCIGRGVWCSRLFDTRFSSTNHPFVPKVPSPSPQKPDVNRARAQTCFACTHFGYGARWCCRRRTVLRRRPPRRWSSRARRFAASVRIRCRGAPTNGPSSFLDRRSRVVVGGGVVSCRSDRKNRNFTRRRLATNRPVRASSLRLIAHWSDAAADLSRVRPNRSSESGEIHRVWWSFSPSTPTVPGNPSF